MDPENRKFLKNFFYTDFFSLTLALITVLGGWLQYLLYLNYIELGDLGTVAAGWEAVRKSIIEYHQIPFWNPWQTGGVPLFANPGVGLFSPVTLFVVIFGSLQGIKITIFFHVIIGTIGMYIFLGDLTKNRLAKYWGAVLFALQGALSIHVSAGHDIMYVIVWFPWILFFIKRMKSSLICSLLLAVIWGVMINETIHYLTVIISFIACIFIFVELCRNYNKRIFFKNLILTGFLLLSLISYRLIVSYDYFSQFPRQMDERVSIPFITMIKALIIPGQYFLSYSTFIIKMINYDNCILQWRWHEFGSYIGIIAVVFFLIAFWFDFILKIIKTRNKIGLFILYKYWYLGTFTTLLLTLDSSSKYLPGYWVRELPFFSSMFVITRWRFFTVFFIIIGACIGLDILLKKLKKNKKQNSILYILVAISVIGLLYNINYCWYKTPKVNSETLLNSVYSQSNTITTSNIKKQILYPFIVKNIGLMYAYEVMLGYKSDYKSKRIPFENKKQYKGEIYSLDSTPVKAYWSPNKIVIDAQAKTSVFINQNPGNYWNLNGVQLFPELKSFDITKNFIVDIPHKGQYTLETVPPVNSLAQFLTLFFLLIFIILLYYFYLKNNSPKKILNNE